MLLLFISKKIVEYDKTHYLEYCCEDHKNNFIENPELNEVKSTNVMSPTLNDKIKHILSKLIYIKYKKNKF